MRLTHSLYRLEQQAVALVRTALLTLASLLLIFISSERLNAQNIPIVSGGIGFFSSTNTGVNFVQPVIAPVFVAPLGRHLLLESRFDIREVYLQQKDGYQGTYSGSTQFLQLDYIAHPKITFIGGFFLTPFGTYNERLTPIWISNFQDAPLIFAIGTRTSGSSTGGMVRGAIFARPSVQVNYVAYFSASSTVSQFQSARSTGDRIDVYFPNKRLEVGTSYARFLQGTHNNSEGAHVWWEPQRIPLQVRSEYAHGPHAQGYWIETAYRLSQWGGADSLIGRLEPVFRLQQTFRNSPGQGDGLPAANTQQVDFGLDYNFQHNVRLNSSYSRRLSSGGNANIWDVSLTYRFLFPLWRGHQ